MKKRVILAGIFFLAVSGVCQGATVPAPYVEIRTNDSAKTLSIYFSLGCFHCLEFLDRRLTWIKQRVDKRQLNVRFLELPGMMPFWEGRTRQAKKNSNLATKYTQCIAREKGEEAYLKALADITRLAKESVRLESGRDWSWYVFAQESELKGGKFSSVADLLRYMLEMADVDERKCDETSFRKYVKDAKNLYENIKTTSDFPLYILDGKPYKFDEDNKIVDQIDRFYAVNDIDEQIGRARKSPRVNDRYIERLLIRKAKILLERGDSREGVVSLKTAADTGSANAAYSLGKIYWEGLYGVAVDKQKGFYWAQRSAEKENMQARHLLGVMYEKGIGNGPQPEKAFAWMKKSASQGYTPAMFALYRYYKHGFGVKKDDHDAHLSLRNSVRNGNISAAFLLAQNYKNGWGVKKRPLVALAWLRVAAVAGDKNAINELKKPDEQELIRKTTFKDCINCPEMTVVPTGSFLMGVFRSDGMYFDQNRKAKARPRHFVNISNPFAVSRFEITNRNWNTCVREGGCPDTAKSKVSKSYNQPKVNISWKDANLYVDWLSRKTGREYRLLTESEWEFVARGGMMTDYIWGNRMPALMANCKTCGSLWDGLLTAPVGSFKANGYSVADTHGNVAEWVQDCLHSSYAGKPPGGKAWEHGQCDQRIVRGGAWNQDLDSIRVYERDAYPVDSRRNFIGFRVAVSLQDKNRD